MDYNKELGKRGEEIAAKYLRQNGYQIIQTNFRARYGELDVVAKTREGTLVFVEVKTRVGDQYGEPIESVTPWKLREVVKTAEFYLLKNRLDCDWRIDVVAVALNPDQTDFEVEHFENVTL